MIEIEKLLFYKILNFFSSFSEFELKLFKVGFETGMIVDDCH